MLPDLRDTAARHALILGMTNSDQVGMQQARAPQPAATAPDHAERLADAGDGAGDGGEDRGEVNEATGLNAEEQAEFDRMAHGGDPEPAATGDATDDNDEEDAGDDDTNVDPAQPAPPAPADGTQKTAAQLAAEAAQGQKPAPKSVSLGKHQRELRKAQQAAAELQTALQKEREDRIKLAERVSIINEALLAQAKQPSAEEAEQPQNPFDEPDVDPTEDYAGALAQERRRNKYAYEAAQGTRQEVSESNEDRQLRDTFTRDFQNVASQPEYVYLPQAYQFLKDARLTQIFLAEFDKDPNDQNEVFTKDEVQKAVQIFNREEKWLVGNAVKANKSPAHAILKQARIYGFKPTAPAAPAAAAAAAVPAAPAARSVPAVPPVRNGAGAPPAPASPTAAEQIAALAAAQDAGRSLSDGGGAPPAGLTAAMLVAMDDEEFGALVDQLTPHQLNTLMGRGPG